MLKLLELFGGIGSPRKALERLGIDLKVVDYVEIDKYAVESYNAIYGENFEPQDITKWDKQIEVDMIFHGSPCQDFSVAGKQAGGEQGSGTRSSLLYETLRIVENLKPKYVLWENVKNVISKKHRQVFDDYLNKMEKLGYTNYYQVLNAKDYGIPQNRERVFTISILGNENYIFPIKQQLKKLPINYIEENANKKYDLTEKNKICYQREFGSKGKQFNLLGLVPTLTGSMGTGGGNVPYFEFPPKQELKLRLKDMLEDEVDEKYYLKDYQVGNILNSNFIAKKNIIQDKICATILSRDYKDPKCVQIGELDIKGQDIIKRVYSNEGLSPTLTDMQGGNRQPKIMIKNATKKGYLEAYEGDGVYTNPSNKRGTVQPQSIQTLTSVQDKGVVMNDLRIRKLTPKECWRLMGFDDEDFDKASKVNSNTQLYKQAGNSIVVNVLVEIFKNLL